MPFSYNITVASGSSDVVSVPFPYLDKGHVHVTKNNVAILDADLVWNNPSQIKLPTMPAAGAVLKVYRSTPGDALLTVWSSPNVFDHRDLNSAMRQLLYVIQEAFDAALEAKAVTDGILTYLDQVAALAAQVTDLYNQVVTLHGQTQTLKDDTAVLWQAVVDIQTALNAIIAAFSVYFDWGVSIPYSLADGEVVAEFTMPEALTYETTAPRIKCHTTTPPSADCTFELRRVNKTTGATIAVLGTYTIASAAYLGTFAKNTGLTYPYAMAADDVVHIVTISAHVSLSRSSFGFAFRRT